MDVSRFTNDPRVERSMAALGGGGPYAVSDITDGDGHRYIDLVMEGGGVLGIALVGYAWALEEMGIRFRSIGGTSAGAISACLLAAAAPPAEPRALRLLAMLSDMDFFSFVDGGDDARDLVRDIFIKRRGCYSITRAVLRNIDEIVGEWGINPGVVFEEWVRERLLECGVESVTDLDTQMNRWPDSMSHNGAPQDMADLQAKLRIVSSEVTTYSKIVFPEMAGLFYDEPEAQNPARFVRASMSVPYFFEPMRVAPLPSGDAARARWRECVGYNGEVPAEAIFLDGGLMSNFPISLFHTQPGGSGPRRRPRLPTFGAKLGRSRAQAARVTGPITMGGAMFNAARQASDFDFLWRNPDYRSLVAEIELDANRDGKDDVHWLNFNLEEGEMIDLFAAGVDAARLFLAGDPKSSRKPFDWSAYQDKREMLFRASDA
ncbi:MAG: patatin-like phospholipase family protein [Phycisphaera sp.]|nr:MAG: patatin-like phospholipase family protein [Phycisphaera sp.]